MNKGERERGEKTIEKTHMGEKIHNLHITNGRRKKGGGSASLCPPAAASPAAGGAHVHLLVSTTRACRACTGAEAVFSRKMALAPATTWDDRSPVLAPAGRSTFLTDEEGTGWALEV